MTLKTNTYLGIVTALAFVLANAAVSWATAEIPQDTMGQRTNEALSTNEESSEIEPEQDPQPSNQQTQTLLKKLEDELNLTKADYHQIIDNISATKARLKQVENEKITLQLQLERLDYEITLSNEKLINVIKDIVQKENEIRLTQEQIQMKEIAMEAQKELLKDYIKIMYEQENSYLTLDEDGEIDAFKLLLSDESVSDNLTKMKYMDLLNEAGQQMVDRLKTLGTELETYKQDLKSQRTALQSLERTLAKEKENLEMQKLSKQDLLRVTKGQEKVFEELIQQSIEEQELVLTDLKNLSTALEFIEQKVQEEGASFDPDKYMDILDERTRALYQFRLNTDSVDGFAWPINPDKGISAYFRDPSYVGVFGVRHNAIDIPAYQGTPIQAAESGVVYTVRDNGYGYSYIILAHAEGFMTVYGHVSDIMVDEGETVSRGSIIGLSGGMPGTLGAGYMTTGPHLHFEVLLNGMYVDPLNYLPLQFISSTHMKENLPEKYWDEWQADVLESSKRRVSPTGVSR